MKSIQKLTHPFQVPQDVRQDRLQWGKFVYLSLLAILSIVTFHFFFGHFYTLHGDGFVYSDNQTIALEFDATITDVGVSEGSSLATGDPIFRFDSLALQERLLDQSLKMSRLQTQLHDATLQLASNEAQQGATERYAHFTAALVEQQSQLAAEQYIGSPQRLSSEHKAFDAARAHAELQLNHATLGESLKRLQNNLRDSSEYYDRLKARFDDGIFRSPVAGMVSNVQIRPGSVLRTGEVGLQVFHGKRYLYCYFDPKSWVSLKEGDKVWVWFPGQRLVRGHVRALHSISERLPQEFQPRFKPTQRQHLAQIAVPQVYIDRANLLSTVSVYKLLFL